MSQSKFLIINYGAVVRKPEIYRAIRRWLPASTQTSTTQKSHKNSSAHYQYKSKEEKIYKLQLKNETETHCKRKLDISIYHDAAAQNEKKELRNLSRGEFFHF